MPFFTVCATNRVQVPRPCAVYYGQTQKGVLTRFESSRRVGEFPFLPEGRRATVRRSSRQEEAQYLEWIRHHTGVPMLESDSSRGPRTQRLAAALAKRLWTGAPS